MNFENFLSEPRENAYIEKSNKSDASFKKIISDNLSNSSVPAISTAYHTNDWFLKIILWFCFLASTGFCGYLTVKTFITFFSFSVLTSTSIVFNIPTECKNYNINE
jgi:hypothetical protein